MGNNKRKRERVQRIIVSIIMTALMASLFLGQTIKADELGQEVGAADISQSTEEEQSIGSNETSEAVNDMDESNSADSQNNVEESQKIEESSNPETESENEQAFELQYVYIANPYVEIPGTQDVVLSFAEGTELSSASLGYYNADTGVSGEIEAVRIEDNLALFQMDYQDETQKGVYVLDHVDVGTQTGIQQFSLAVQGIEGKYGVGKECVTNPDEVIEEEFIEKAEETVPVEVNVTTINETGTIEDSEVINEVIEETLEETMGTASLEDQTNKVGSPKTSRSPIVIVLDPGHDNNHPGAQSNGYAEEKITLKLAQYCKEALNSYGVDVYLTRNGGECPSVNGPVSGHKESEESVCLKNRAEYAKNMGANIFVSFHLNSFTSATAKGAEVYYASSTTNAAAQNESEEMAKKIAAELKKLGLTLRNNQYGTNTANFSVLRNSIAYNIPAVLIEHCFVSNPTEAEKYLSSDAKLKELGSADAKGIIEYLNLVEGEWIENSTGRWFRYPNGTYPKDCWAYINGAWYHFDSRGYMQTGFLEVDGNKYYLNDEGIRTSGWQKIENKWYFFDADGKMVIGWLKRGSNWYYLNPSDNASGSKGSMITGWLQDGNSRYYLNPEQNSYGAEGIMRTGWLQEGGRWYFLNTEGNSYGPKGSVRTGWLQRGNNRYYLQSDGVMVIGWLELSGKKYYFDQEGHMVTGEKTIDGNKYTFSSDGSLLSDNGTAVQAGWQKKGTEWYFYNGDGSLAIGWLKRGSNWYYLNPEQNSYGARGKMLTGWLKESNNWYYLNPEQNSYGAEGIMRTGWLQRGSIWYFLNTEGNSFGPKGSMRTGWLERGSNKYYLNPVQNSYGAEGVMATGWREIDGTTYYFNTKGRGTEGLLVHTGITQIMGKSVVTVEQMTKMYVKSGKKYPSDSLKNGGAATINDFCQIVYEEAEREGVKAEVVFAQAMLETGYLQFGGDVLISQYNFAGLGATGNGVRGEKFPDVRTGIRAQVQHLKAYASDEALKQPCVDNRFKYVERNCAPYVEWLGQKENPTGKGWAASMSYGFNMKKYYIDPMYVL